MFNIQAKQNLPEEIEVIKLVEDICIKYPIPVYTHNVIVEKGAIPHSHPILTLNTRTRNPLLILHVLIHEQFHWFTSEHPKHKECIECFKNKYRDNEECDSLGNNKDSFWEHLIVCFNTRDYLKTIVIDKELTYIYSQWQAYPKTEQLVIDNYETIQEDLAKYDLLFNKKDLPIYKKPE